jgi:hypothetical protein
VSTFGARLSLAAVVLFAAGAVHAAKIRMFSYDPADAETRAAAGPMTFQFRQGLLKSTILTLRSTEADATVDVAPAPESALGGARLTTLAGPEAADRELYAIRQADDGAALIAALCPGSARGWLAIGRPRYGSDLGVDVLGDGPGGRARLCRKLAFNFHGEWRGPDTGKFDSRILSHPTGGPRGDPGP